MISLGNLLVVDDSIVCRKVLATVMAPYCDRSSAAGSAREAIDLLVSPGGFDLVLCDVVMKDGDGFEVLEHVASMGDAAPRIVMVTAFPREQAAKRSLDLGADAYLSKPTTVRKILNVVGELPGLERRELKSRWRCPGKAYLIEGESDPDAFVAWDVYNLSATGAFLETKGPLPVGAELDLLLVVAGQKARVSARVIRVQEPSWINVGGVGVQFVDPSDELGSLLEGVLQALEPEDSSRR